MQDRSPLASLTAPSRHQLATLCRSHHVSCLIRLADGAVLLLDARSEAEVSVAAVRPGREGQAFPSWRWLMETSETSRSGEPAGSGDPRRARSERELPGGGESRDSAPQRRQRRGSFQVAVTKCFGRRRKKQLCAASAPWCAASAPRPRPDTPIAPSFAIGPTADSAGRCAGVVQGKSARREEE
jgi:hypothetical protein